MNWKSVVSKNCDKIIEPINKLEENKNTDENCLVYIDEEYLEGLKQRCLLNGIGLIGISNFEYTFIDHFLTKKNVFNLNVSAIDLLENENINCDQQIDNLNYLLDF